MSKCIVYMRKIMAVALKLNEIESFLAAVVVAVMAPGRRSVIIHYNFLIYCGVLTQC